MWPDILLSIIQALAEAIHTNYLKQQERPLIRNRIRNAAEKLLFAFSDTSLDCKAFYDLVISDQFQNYIKLYFYSVCDEGISTTSFKTGLISCIQSHVDHVNMGEVISFAENLESLYTSVLENIIHQEPTLECAFMLQNKVNHDAFSKLFANQEKIKQYLNAMVPCKAELRNADIETYHRVNEAHFEMVQFTGISGAERTKARHINECYVDSTFSYLRSNLPELFPRHVVALHGIVLNQIFDLSNKIVILGGAGFGKTTSMNYMYCNYEELFGPCSIKFKIDLKSYAKEIFDNHYTILDCLVEDFYNKIPRRNISRDQITEMLSEKLTEGHCVVILDALDEIPTQTARAYIRDRIEEFTEIYSYNRFIITSREAGYLKNRFDRGFLHLQLNELGYPQVMKFIESWHKYNQIEVNFSEFISNFMEEVNRAKCQRLIRNPIILILALVIFDIERNLPNTRVEFYSKCIDTFLTTREDRRSTQNLSENAKNIIGTDSVLPHIAYCKFSHIEDDMEYRFSLQALHQAILEAIEVPDPINWMASIREYTVYLIERTELIREIDEDRYDFTHKTFYEYFLAVYYVKTFDNETLIDLLDEWIGDANYNELAKLIIEVIIKINTRIQHNQIMEYLLQALESRSFVNSHELTRMFNDLYGHGMLLPKFRKRYFNYILHNALYVTRTINMDDSEEDADIVLNYDSAVMAQMFLDEVEMTGLTPSLVESIYALDEDYSAQITQISNIPRYRHLPKLFSLMPYLQGWRPKLSDPAPAKEEWAYFTADPDGSELLIKDPLVYLSACTLMAYLDIPDAISLFIRPDFLREPVISKSPSYYLLSYLIDRMTLSPEFFVVLLILITKYAQMRVNTIFKTFTRLENRNHDSLNCQRAKNILWLWHLLHETASYDAFCEELWEAGIFKSEYSDTLRYLYHEFMDRYAPQLTISQYNLMEEFKKLQSHLAASDKSGAGTSFK